MVKFLIILFIIKLFTRINVFKYVTKKHRQNIVKSLEQIKRNYSKVNENMSFIKICKKNTYCQNLLWSGSQLEMAVWNLKKKLVASLFLNSFKTEVPIIQKPVCWFGPYTIATLVMKELIMEAELQQKLE